MENPPAVMPLPPELELQIVKTLALACPSEIPRLVLVARRFHVWLQGLLYRTIVNDPECDIEGLPIPAAHTQPLRPPLRRARDWGPVVAACPAVRNVYLGCNTAAGYRALLAGLAHLEQLHCGSFDLPWDANTHTHTHTHTHVLGALTHLELFDRRTVPLAETRVLARMCPRLTHLAVNDHFPELSECEAISKTCPVLEALVLIWPMESEAEELEGGDLLGEDVAVGRADVRAVVALLPHACERDWQQGCLTGMDFWSAADEFIALRRSGGVDGELSLLLLPQKPS
ncbi:unnamed protein product [Mycena citricolor]|uniref:F-box domain-containing protein n=1 Tax=Mycena citricolor TaxID=2018698 RepID=A0AAD2H240_9AGAR|nr:unnamed protein product [Mycena citricolor]